jgi:hypothetical protein
MTISYVRPSFLPKDNQLSPASRLALITIRQFAEGFSDRQAAEAVRIRIDWKYALNLELSHPGFDFSVLCEFRARLLGGHAEQLLFETMLDQFKTHGQSSPSRGNFFCHVALWPCQRIREKKTKTGGNAMEEHDCSKVALRFQRCGIKRGWVFTYPDVAPLTFGVC